MAPIKIKHVVSFSSQDPKYCVENIFCSDATRPWLCSPKDHTGILKVELQLEKVSAIGYIDIGNCGSALIQVDVGRSSWPHDVPYEALLATASLMSPVESRQGINRTGVRMFKSGDFLSQARNELWDRVRVTCSQPFNKHTQFGLSFLRICTPEDESEHSVVTETQIVQEKSKSNDLRKQAQDWLSSPTVQKIFNGQMQMKCSSEATQTNLLSMDSTSNCCMKDLAFLSRTARMVISARQSQLPNRRMSGAESFHCEESNATDQVKCEKDNSAGCKNKQVNKKKKTGDGVLRSSCHKRLYKGQRNLVNISSSRQHTRRNSPSLPDDKEEAPLECCPICGGHVSFEYLPLHASSCNGAGDMGIPDLEQDCHFPSSSEERVQCPVCGFRFPLSEIERHASGCGEPNSSSWIFVD